MPTLGDRATVVLPPDSHESLSGIARDTLKGAGQYGVFPTNLDILYDYNDISKIENTEEKEARFKESLDSVLRAKLERSLRKVKGAYGFRKKEVWIPSQKSPVYERFPGAHELGHAIIPWHELSFMDDRFTLLPTVKETFETEANFIASEILFQGDIFKQRVLDSHESIDSALVISEEFETSKISTLWRYAQVQDRPVGLLIYEKKYNGSYKLRRVIVSEKMMLKFSGIEIPDCINSDHFWIERGFLDIGTKKGECHLADGKGKQKIDWESWSNSYDMFVLVSVRSSLHVVSNIFDAARSLVKRSSN